MRIKIRRIIPFIFLSLAACIILSLTTCRGEFCDNYEDDPLTREISVSATVFYNDQSPYQGPVVFSIKMINCKDETSGYSIVDDISSNASGQWQSAMSYTYTMTYFSDEILIRFQFENPVTSEPFDVEFITDYLELEQLSASTNLSYTITLPWNP